LSWDTFLYMSLLLVPLLVIPGPGNLMTFSVGARRGFGRGFIFVVGLNSATLIWSLLLLPSGNALLTQSWIPFTLLQGLSATYIGYLAYRMMAVPSSNKGQSLSDTGFSAGFLLQALNPKFLMILIFILAQDMGLSLVSALAFGLYFTALNIANHCLYLLAGSLLKHTVTSDGWSLWRDRSCGLLLLSMAVWMAFSALTGA
jgi:homoserine/homoserine lactone efflux protein